MGDVCGVPKTRLLSGWRFNRPVCVWGWGGERRRLWRRGGGEAPERFQISLVPAPRPSRSRPCSEWLRQGRPRAGAGRVPGRGYKGTRHRPLPTHSSCQVLPAPLPRSSRTPSLARLPQPAWTPRAPPDGRHRLTGRQAGRRAGGRARPAARGLSDPSKRSSAIGAGDSRAERPARPPAGLPPACPNPRLDPRSRARARLSAGERPVAPGEACQPEGSVGWWGKGPWRGPATAGRESRSGTSWGGGSRTAGDRAWLGRRSP